MKKTLLVAVTMLLASSLAHAQSPTGNTIVSVAVAPEASMTVSPATTSLTTTGTVFNNFTGTTTLTYKIRTTRVGGTGTITVFFGGALTGVAVPGNTIALSNLTYDCTGLAPGTPCSAGQISNTSATPVATFGADAHGNGATGTVAWTLVNDPAYVTDTYNATATFTVAAL
jgi:hypothetical protein